MTSLFVKALDMVRDKAPWFLKQIKKAQREKTAITLTLDTFDDDAFLLYAALLVARRARVKVCFISSHGKLPRE